MRPIAILTVAAFYLGLLGYVGYHSAIFLSDFNASIVSDMRDLQHHEDR